MPKRAAISDWLDRPGPLGGGETFKADAANEDSQRYAAALLQKRLDGYQGTYGDKVLATVRPPAAWGDAWGWNLIDGGVVVERTSR